MTREQLKANGWIEDAPGHFIKGSDVRIPTPDHQITVGGIEKPTPKRIRQSSKPLLNKLEEEFLVVLRRTWPIHQIRPQAKRYRLANGLWYTPDFTLVAHSCELAYEVKGPHAWDDAIAKLKMFAHEWTEIKVWLAWKDNGEWKMQEILP